MKLKEYIKYRQVLDDLEINIIDKEKYRKIGNDYDILVQLAEDEIKKESKKDKIHEVHWEDYSYWFFVGFGILLGLLFQMGYATPDDKEINIGAYLFWVITAPIIIFIITTILKYKQKKAEKTNIYCFKKLFNLIFKIKILNINHLIIDTIKKSSCYYIQITSIAYSIFSILLLLYHTGIKKYLFNWDSTWIGSTIIKIYSIPVDFINSNFIPIELKQEATKTLQGENSENWLFFLILLTIVWIIIPRIILSIFYYFKLKQDLKKSFIFNPRSEKIINDIKKSYDFKFVENNQKESEKEQTNDLRQNIIFWQLSNTQEKFLKSEKIFDGKNIISLETVKDLNNHKFTDNKEIIILINSDAPPQYTIINLINKLIDFSCEYKFVDSNGFFIENETESIREWFRFIKEHK